MNPKLVEEIVRRATQLVDAPHTHFPPLYRDFPQAEVDDAIDRIFCPPLGLALSEIRSELRRTDEEIDHLKRENEHLQELVDELKDELKA